MATKMPLSQMLDITLSQNILNTPEDITDDISNIHGCLKLPSLYKLHLFTVNKIHGTKKYYPALLNEVRIVIPGRRMSRLFYFYHEVNKDAQYNKIGKYLPKHIMMRYNFIK